MKIEYHLIKAKDKTCSTKKQFNNLLLTVDNLDLSKNKLVYKKEEFRYGLNCSEVKENDEVVFHLVIEYKKDDTIDVLEELDGVLLQLFDNAKFKINLLWNDIFVFYTNKLYPLISSLENKARSLIYLLMTKACGSKWEETYIPQNVKEKVTSESERNNLDKENNIFFSLDFIDIGTFLFKKYRIKDDINSLIEEINKEPFDVAKIRQESKYYEEKSNWDRFFKDISEIDSLEKEWGQIYYFRNIVAHNKAMSKKSFIKAKDLIDTVCSALDKTREKIDDIVIPSDEIDSLKDLYSKVFTDSFYETMKSLNESLKTFQSLNTNSILKSLEPIKTINYNQLYKDLWAENQISTSKALLEIVDPKNKDK